MGTYNQELNLEVVVAYLSSIYLPFIGGEET